MRARKLHAATGDAKTTAAHALTIPRYTIALRRDGEYVAETVTMGSSRDVTVVLRPLFAGADRELFAVACLDAKHHLIGVNVVSVGSLTLSIVHPREVFKPVILLNACAVVLAHNHPSGDPTPSPEDRTLTARLVAAGELLGIRVLDHVILTDDGPYYSFADQGQLNQP
jgi:DNA repair protein RadC